MKMPSPLTYISPTRGDKKKKKNLSHRGTREKSYPSEKGVRVI